MIKEREEKIKSVFLNRQRKLIKYLSELIYSEIIKCERKNQRFILLIQVRKKKKFNYVEEIEYFE